MNRPSTPALKSAEAQSLPEKRRVSAIEWVAVIAVFALTFVLRWPFLAESFWIDELHTAWCIADDWSEVAPRAKMGNQQPLYFWLLWSWQQIPWPEPWASYPVEVLPRLTSLWCVSLSAALIVWGSFRYHGSLVAALVAGIAVAIDRQAAFFGVELRPYAAVILGSTFAIGFAARLWAFPDRGLKRDWTGLHASVLFAMLMHITSLITLAPLIAALTASDLFHSRHNSAERKRKLWRHAGWLSLWILAGLLLANHQHEIWNRREAWSSFGRPNSIFAFWKMWPWLGWTIIPTSIVLLCFTILPTPASPEPPRACVTTASKPIISRDRTTSFALLLLGVLLTSVISAMLLSEWGGVPIWQRRYLIAGLPLGCISLGGWIASLRHHSHSRWVAPLIAIPSLAAIVWSQGSIHPSVATHWVYRDEDWRGALQQIADSAQPQDSRPNDAIQHHLWIDGDLIEQPAITGRVTDVDLATYLTLPARGPYSPGKHTLLHAVGSLAPMEGWQQAVQSSGLDTPHSKHWFLSRWLPSNQRTSPLLNGRDIRSHGQFGNLFLYSQPASED
ncbi:putative transmembrane protein [Rhodopirellula islandica]|uniref:Transmembrane protein n=1 Tax=Rhodopirellula islandica TaxID=595434 RepID=A0A0J1B950_RHOIS|nr:hypothetical protein [Rhodopirellula islandica]KLU03058.1 putative transmembrane protein [Rhodopirellula islandica]